MANQGDNEDTPTRRDTDPSELARLSTLPHGPATHDEVLQALQALAGELVAVRQDMAAIRHALIEEPSWAKKVYNQGLDIVSRVEKVEGQAQHGFPICRYHHSNGHKPVSPDEGE